MPKTHNDNIMLLRSGVLAQFESMADKRMIYVNAPAGYGKTVAVTQWLERSARAKAFITLDEYDNGMAVFCGSFCAALVKCQPYNKALMEIVSHPAFTSAPEEFAIRAVSALASRKGAVLAIDDLHLIKEMAVLKLMIVLLKRLPDIFQIILISRHELPSLLLSMMLKGSIGQVNVSHLRFSDAEIMSLFGRSGSHLTKQQAHDIAERTQGWAIGINVLLQAGNAPDEAIFDNFDEYARLNIWDHWKKDDQEFMIMTCLPNELEPALCTMLTGVEDAERMLSKLVRNGVFITKAGTGMYRYHHLFQDNLKRLLAERGAEFTASLLRTEGDYRLSQKDFYSSIDCFIRANDFDGIARCFDFLEVSDRNDFVIERMLPILKNQVVRNAADEFPHLYFLIGWAALIEGRGADMAECVDQYNARFPEIAARTPEYAHNIIYMRLWDYRVSLRGLLGEMQTPTLPSANSEVKGIQGSTTLNLPLFLRSSVDFSEFAIGDAEANMENLLTHIGWILGEETNLIAESLTACLLYEKGLLEKARLHALAAYAEIRKHFAPESKFHVVSILIYILDALGETDEADKTFKRVMVKVEEDRAYYLLRNLNALSVRRKIQKGDTKAAKNWLESHDFSEDAAPTLYGIYQDFTICRARIAVKEYDLATIMLTKILALAQMYNRPLDIIEARMLLAISHWHKRDYQEQALQYLEAAIQTARPYEYAQLFANESELSGMLLKIQKRLEHSGGDKDSIAFVKSLYIKSRIHPDKTPDAKQPPDSALPNESVHLTAKQIIVMKHIGEGKSHSEAAALMGIKTSTLRSHLDLIYKKLGVNNEIDAVAKLKNIDVSEKPFPSVRAKKKAETAAEKEE